MSQSTSSIGRSDARRPSTLQQLLASATRYDFVLAVIPLCLLLSLAASAVTPLALHQTVAVGSLAGSVALADAMFLNPPESGERS